MNCTKVSIPSLWDEKAEKQCTIEYINGCKQAKIKKFCKKGSNDYLSNRNVNCEPIQQSDSEYGMDFYSLCCNVCAAGKQAFLDKKSCKHDLPDNADKSQLIAEMEFENCCTSFVTNRLRSTNDHDEEYNEEESDICSKFACEHFCEELDFNLAACSCRIGYRLNSDNRKCDDIDECSDSSLNICGPNEQCKNLPGSFECVENITETKLINSLNQTRQIRNLNDEKDAKYNCNKNEYFDVHRNKCIGK